jgi:hypothetical protein
LNELYYSKGKRDMEIITIDDRHKKCLFGE